MKNFRKFVATNCTGGAHKADPPLLKTNYQLRERIKDGVW